MAMLIYFDDWEYAAAVAVVIGEGIDSDFSDDDAIIDIVYDGQYTAAGMTLFEVDEFYVLAPTKYINELLDK